MKVMDSGLRQPASIAFPVLRLEINIARYSHIENVRDGVNLAGRKLKSSSNMIYARGKRQ